MTTTSNDHELTNHLSDRRDHAAQTWFRRAVEFYDMLAKSPMSRRDTRLRQSMCRCVEEAIALSPDALRIRAWRRRAGWSVDLTCEDHGTIPVRLRDLSRAGRRWVRERLPDHVSNAIGAHLR